MYKTELTNGPSGYVFAISHLYCHLLSTRQVLSPSRSYFMRNFMEKRYHLQYSITAKYDTTPTQATEEPQNAKMPRKDFNLTVLISIDFPKRLCNSDVFMEKCQEKESNALDEGWLKLVYCLDSFDYH